jgi:hypothetical protein
MHKLVFALMISATALAALPAQAAQSSIKAGHQCFKPTDSSRGFGYWTACDNVYAFTVGRRAPTFSIDQNHGDGGGGDGGGGGNR